MVTLACVVCAQVETHDQKAAAYLAKKDTAAAIGEYRAAIGEDPRDLQALANAGVLEFFAGDCVSAASDLRGALAISASLDKLRGLLGICEKKAGDFAAAERDLADALPHVTDLKAQSLIAANLVALYYAREDLERAQKLVEDQLTRDSGNVELLYMAYRVNTELADRARNAIAMYAPDSARMHEIMAERFVNDGDSVRAVEQYEAALRRDPNLPGIHFELGEALLQDSQSPSSQARAKSEFEWALKEDPANAGAEAKLGRMAAQAGDKEEAERRFQRALKMRATELDALTGMSDIEAGRHERDAAIRFLKQALEVAPLDEHLHYKLAQIYRGQGEAQLAEAELAAFRQIRAMKKKTDLADVSAEK